MLWARQQSASGGRTLTCGVIPVFDPEMPFVERMPPARDVPGGDDPGGAVDRAGGIANPASPTMPSLR
jgi:hypothetical protein